MANRRMPRKLIPLRRFWAPQFRELPSRLLNSLMAVALCKDGVLDQSIVSFSRAGAGMVEVTPGVWEWGRHNYIGRSDSCYSSAWNKRGGLVVEPDGTIHGLAALGNNANTYYCIPCPQASGWSICIKRISKSGILTIEAVESPGRGSYMVDLSKLGDSTETVTESHPAVSCIAAFNGDPGGLYFFSYNGDALDLQITNIQFNRGAVQPYLRNMTDAPYYAPREGTDANGERFTLLEGQGSNLYTNNYAPAVESIVVTAQAYTLSLVGAGSVTLSGAYAGTLAGTGGTNRVSLTFTPTSGTLVVTPSGSPQYTQLEAGSIATSPIPTYGAAATRAADVCSVQAVDTGLTDAAGCVVGRWVTATDNTNHAVLATDSGVSSPQYSGWTGLAVQIEDGTAGTYSDAQVGVVRTAVTSYGPAGQTAKAGAGAEHTTTYDGTMVSSSLRVGSKYYGDPMNGKLYQLHTIPSQPDATTRTKLAALWS